MKKDNRGLTLIELMIAVTMLAVVISPFLNAFVAAAKQNNKAREALRATTVAQNLMESMRAFTLEEVMEQIAGDKANSKLYMPGGYEAHKEVPQQGADADTRHEFLIQGIEEDGKKYDARIVTDVSTYETNTSVGNDMEVSMMNEATDAILSVSEADDQEVIDGWSGGSGWNRWEADESNTERTFHIEIKDNVLNADQTDITIKVEYKTDKSPTSKVSTKELVKTLNSLNNVYIMYYPNYSRKKDNFVVTYNTAKECNLYLVKQKYGTGGKDERGYTTSLTVTDRNSDGKARITLRTNILDNFYLGSNENQDVGIEMTYKYNSETDKDKIESLLGFWNGKPQSLVGQKHKSNSIYKTTVQIYPEGTYPDQFDTEQPLAELGN